MNTPVRVPDELFAQLAMDRGEMSKEMWEAIERLPTEKQRAFYHANYHRLKAMRDAAASRVDRLKKSEHDLDALIAWMEGGTHRLTSCGSSAYHRLFDAARSGKLDHVDASLPMPDVFSSVPHVIVLEHDWASALKNAEDFSGGEVERPFDFVAFEMCISGRRTVCLKQGEWSGSFIELDHSWWRIDVGSEKYSGCSIIAMMNENARAACIALDAQVAVRVPHRAPERLNAKREKMGRPPLLDFHTISLAKRERTDCAGSGGTHKSPRLHFRRGHWRHYDTHKTWVRWTLVGNPDLGFIDKDYRL